MDLKTFSRLGIACFVAASVFVAVRGLDNNCCVAKSNPDAPLHRRKIQDAELDRCLVLGNQAAHDSTCLRIWAEHRRRFLGLDHKALPSLPAHSHLQGR